MSDDRRNIKVSAETFDALRDDKPDGVTWDYYLTEIRNNTDTKINGDQ